MFSRTIFSDGAVQHLVASLVLVQRGPELLYLYRGLNASEFGILAADALS